MICMRTYLVTYSIEASSVRSSPVRPRRPLGVLLACSVQRRRMRCVRAALTEVGGQTSDFPGTSSLSQHCALHRIAETPRKSDHLPILLSSCMGSQSSLPDHQQPPARARLPILSGRSILRRPHKGQLRVPSGHPSSSTVWPTTIKTVCL